jgi:hypothetical protein
MGMSSAETWKARGGESSSASGSLTKIWRPSQRVPGTSGISSCNMPAPAWVQWNAPGVMRERSPRLSRLVKAPADQGNIQVTAAKPAWG